MSYARSYRLNDRLIPSFEELEEIQNTQGYLQRRSIETGSWAYTNTVAKNFVDKYCAGTNLKLRVQDAIYTFWIEGADEPDLSGLPKETDECHMMTEGRQSSVHDNRY